MVKNFSPSILHQTMIIDKKVYDFRIKAVYIVNPTPIANRIHFCKKQKELLQFIPKEMLPSDYGGDGKSLDELYDVVKRKFVEYQDRFDQMDDWKIDESLRPQKLKNDDVMGFYGNFKKLEID